MENMEPQETNKIELSVDITDVLTYSLHQNGQKVIKHVVVSNKTDDTLSEIMLRVTADTGIIVPFEQGIQAVAPQEEYKITDLNVLLDGAFLASLTERVTSNVTITLSKGEEVLAEKVEQVKVLAYDEWPGLKCFPDMLAAFVMPNHPVVTELQTLSSKWMGKWTDSPSLEGYQATDISRIKYMAASAYAAIQEKNITYANPPTSFEEIGQRVRLCDTIMEQHLGTCLDMTLLYASVLEAIGLNPILVMMQGHIFVGIWLVDESFSDPIVDDPSQLEKRMANGINELLVVECTAMCAGKTLSFDDAMAMAKKSLSDYSNFVFAIDVLRARRSGVRPLPVRIKTDAGYVIEHHDRKEKDVTARPEEIGIVFDVNNEVKTKITKQEQWERKLLDLSLRNMLINMRITRAVVPLLSADVAVLEDSLADGEAFSVMPRPMEWDLAEVNIFSEESSNNLGPYKDLIELEYKHRRIPTTYNEKELGDVLTKMYRQAKSSMEENGASTLYLALGLLRWFEGKKDAQPRYAPIVLIPIEITRKAAGKGYTMCMRDEDAQINITLLEFLKQNYDTEIIGLNPPPVDEHGLDIPRIFTIVRHAIMSHKMWDVIESAFIGNFSFSQFVMWNDIHSKSEFLNNNKIVNSLMDGAVKWDCTIPEGVESDEAYLPIEVDSSQIRAINMAAGGCSFVLHGPPGTGKSQTITAMIANALTKGKTVLFVAEKMAALEVVQKRLTALGIGDFCLELHSNKATKKAVLDQLKRTLEIPIISAQTGYENKIEDIREMRAVLDGYAQTLHCIRPFGKSLRELIDLYEFIPNHDKEIAFSTEFAGSLTQGDLDDQIHILERLIAAGKGVNHPANHPLSAVGQTVYTQSLKMELEGVLKAYIEALEKFGGSVSKFAELMDYAKPLAKGEWNKLCDYARTVEDTEIIPTFLIKTSNYEAEFIAPRDYLKKKAEVDEKKTFLTSKWNENFLKLDMDSYYKKFDAAEGKVIGKGRAFSNLISELQSFANFPIVKDNIKVLLADIKVYQGDVKALEGLERNLSSDWRVLISSIKTEAALEEFRASTKLRLSSVDEVTERLVKADERGNKQAVFDLARKIKEDKKTLEDAQIKADELLKLTVESSGEDYVEHQISVCREILANVSIIKDWIVYKDFEKEARDAGLSPVCDAYLDGMDHDELIDVYRKSIYKSIALHIIESEPSLNSFTGISFNERIQQFKKLDKEFMDLTREEMFFQLTHNLPYSTESVEISKELNILRRAISSNGRGLSIRNLFDQIQTIIRRLCPCMLMSPISVAQYLNTENNLFDIVIFDEASQMPTCKAVGVLARAENAVIVGDPNQMPPTSFFAGNTVDEDNLDIEDLDSILDDCMALGMPDTHLQWHYRSRHESLIAFSNNEFYENKMLTFPSVNDRERRVRLVKVDGVFDRGKGRVNVAEANQIVAEIKRRYKDQSLQGQSVGVVTFNVTQQTLIEDLLQAEFTKDPKFDLWANTSEEPLFVKNLENVQGDERDVILFSVAYGPDAAGKLMMNFGPINKEGGWKRLNVAVSRARDEMLVFATLRPEMIDLKRTRAKGVEALKNFLEFAEKGNIDGAIFNHAAKRQGILESICNEIKNAGYDYQISVGHSNFKIDIAVVNPYDAESYILGILLDGESYKQSANTKDREVAQIEVLKRLGWNIIRVWAMDWWDNKDKEISYIMSEIEKFRAEAEAQMKVEHEQVTEGEEIVEEPDAADESVSEVLQDPPTPVIEEKETDGVVATAEVIPFEMANKTEEIEDVVDPAMVAKLSGVSDNSAEVGNIEYQLVDYQYADLEFTPMATGDFVKFKSIEGIANKISQVMENEAPISKQHLIKRVLRSYDIKKSSTQTVEALDAALEKVSVKVTEQNETPFYWMPYQQPQNYALYRMDANNDVCRRPEDITQEEMKNIIVLTLRDNGPMYRDDLVKATVKKMGYSRSGSALVDAVDRGLRYGKTTGEIRLDFDDRYCAKE